MASASLKNRIWQTPLSFDVNLRDFQHASRLFVDNDLDLAPKSKFNFHVVFSIDPSAVSGEYADLLLNTYRNEINMLVKKIDLPKFGIKTDTLNQYNRKKVTQITSEFKPVSLSFHDDGVGVVRKLWESYYSYYYGDPTAAKKWENFDRSAMKNFDMIKSKYGFDNGSKPPFFRNITIYHMYKHEYNSYALINPVITEWNHDTMDYSVGNTLSEHNLVIAYEAVAYGSGHVAPDSPAGFAVEHYDQVKSPIIEPSKTQLPPTMPPINESLILQSIQNAQLQNSKNISLSNTGIKGQINSISSIATPIIL